MERPDSVATLVERYRGILAEPAHARFRLDAASELAEAVLRELGGGTHFYVSTACQHGLHARCRLTCKFCTVPCACPCGHPVLE